jgi:uncharacterized damage-inducible protein DinB
MSLTVEQVATRLAPTRAQLLTALAQFGDARFHERPASGGWGAADVAEHLVRVETRIVAGARRTVETGKGATPVAWDALLKLPMKLGLVDGIHVRAGKALDPVEDDVASGFTCEQMLGRLAATRESTLAFLEETRDRDLDGLWLKHPFFGCFAVRDFIAWIGWHEARHTRQVGRIARALGVGPAR